MIFRSSLLGLVVLVLATMPSIAQSSSKPPTTLQTHIDEIKRNVEIRNMPQPAPFSGFDLLERSFVLSEVTASDAVATNALAVAQESAKYAAPVPTTLPTCNGRTDDTIAISANAVRGAFRIPGTDMTRCKTNYPYNGAPGGFTGPGRIITSDGYPRAPFFTHLSAPPASYGNTNSGQTAFTGDLTQILTHEHQWTGFATLGQPTRGYFQPLENSADVLDVYNESGFNASLSGNGGRTGAAAHYTNLRQYGQGDLSDYFCAGIVDSTKKGATNFLANPEIACLAGHLFAGTDGAFIEGIGDLDITDNKHDIGAVAESLGLLRTNAAENIGTFWLGRYLSSIGTMPIDAFDSLNGKAVVGYDLSNVKLGYWRLASATMNSSGLDYTVGDKLINSSAEAITPTVFTVTGVTVNNAISTSIGAKGSIATYTITNTGIYKTPPVNQYTTIPFSGGTGFGASFSGVYDSNNAILLPTSGGCIKPGGNGTSISEESSIYSKLCIDQGGMSFGGLSNKRSGAPGSMVQQFGDRNISNGTLTTEFGLGASDQARIGGVYQSSALINYVPGSSQAANFVLTGTTSGTLPVRLTTDGQVSSGQSVLNIPDETQDGFRVVLTARDTINHANRLTWSLPVAMLSRGFGAASTMLDQGEPTALGAGTGVNAKVVLAADTKLGGLRVTFTPPSGNVDTWNVSARVDLDEVR